MEKFVNFNSVVRSAFNDDENDFVAFKKLLADAYHGTVEGQTARSANDKIVEIFRKAIGCDEHSTKAEVRKAIRRNQTVIFEIIEDVVQDLLISGWEDDPFFREYVEIRNIALGDKNEFFVEDNSILSVMKVSGDHHDIIRQRIGAGSLTSVVTSWVGAKIYAEFERVATNVETWATLVTRINEAYTQYVNEALYDALVSAASSLGSQWYKSSALSDTTAPQLRTLCMDVAIATGHEVVIMGTRTALASVIALQNVSWASEEMKNERNQTGRFGYWEGIRLVEIPQRFKKNDTTSYLVANDLLFIMPVSDTRFIKFVNEGDTQIYQVTDSGTNMDMTYTYELQTKLGIAVLTNLKFGCWKILAA